MTLLKNISFFPYSSWWRLGGKSELKSQFGGICTLVIVVLVGIIFAFRLAQVFNKTKLTVAQSFQQQDYRAFYNFTTYQNDPNQRLFMVAINSQPTFSSNEGNLTDDDIRFRVFNKYTNTTTAQTQQIYFEMQKCTAEHITNVPSVIGANVDKYRCMPVNKTFYFGGDPSSSNISNLQIQITCNSQACESTKDTLQFQYYVLKTTPTPYNRQSAISIDLQQQSTYFSRKLMQYSTVHLSLNKIVTDNSLLPTEDFSQKIFYSPNDAIYSETYSYEKAITVIQIKSSRGLSFTYKRTYQKLLDAISYIGGIFQSFLALFFFVQIFNASQFQMKFASKYFKCKEAKSFYFGKFLKQTVYDLLHQTRFQPQWKETEIRRKVKEAVVSLQDIVYINRRIDFLEKAISVLFQKHQLKGLRLLHNKTDSEVMRDYNKQKFRDQFIFFLKRKQIIEIQQPQHERPNIDDSIMQVDEGAINKQKTMEVYENKRQQKYKSEIKIDYQQILAENKTGILMDPKVEMFQSSQNIIKHSQLRHSRKLGQQIKRQDIFDEVEEDEELHQFNNTESDDLLIEEIEGDLKRLVMEAQKPTGDKRSKRIFQQLESEMREMLKAAIVQLDGKRVKQAALPKTGPLEINLLIR